MREKELLVRKDSGLNIYVAGAGAREHAITKEILKSDRVKNVWTGTAAAVVNKGGEKAVVYRFDSRHASQQAVDICTRNAVDLAIIGPENPLIEGIVDDLAENGIPAFGPRKDFGWVEGDKEKAKDFMRRNRIPTAEYRVFRDYSQATQYVKSKKELLVVKDPYPVLGKGAFVCDDQNEALVALEKIMVKKELPSPGDKVVIEERLFGIEQSITAIISGEDFLVFRTARDYKHHKGKSTGGMGGHSPDGNEDIFSDQKVIDRIIIPFIEGVRREIGKPYKGLFYPGLMWIYRDGEWQPQVLEFNIRGGDPETQLVLPAVNEDPVEIILNTINGKLGESRASFSQDTFLGVYAVSGTVPKQGSEDEYEGYPGKYKEGQVITGIQDIEEDQKGYVLHGGTRWVCHDQKEHLGQCNDGHYETAGGRVALAIGRGPDLPTARNNGYDKLNKFSFNYKESKPEIGDPELLRREREQFGTR